MAQTRPPHPALAPRSAGERAIAWLYTGPLGHFWSAVADISSLWLRWALPQARSRLGERLRSRRAR